MPPDKRCQCECHIPDRHVLHIDACCYRCGNCDEDRILWGTSPHTCGPIHLGQETAQGAVLECKAFGPFQTWESSKSMPRKISKVRQGDQASVFFSFKHDKATCPACLACVPVKNDDTDGLYRD